jgi:hypothetical protein
MKKIFQKPFQKCFHIFFAYSINIIVMLFFVQCGTAVSGVACPQGGWPAAIFYPLGYPMPYGPAVTSRDVTCRHMTSRVVVDLTAKGENIFPFFLSTSCCLFICYLIFCSKYKIPGARLLFEKFVFIGSAVMLSSLEQFRLTFYCEVVKPKFKRVKKSTTAAAIKFL